MNELNPQPGDFLDCVEDYKEPGTFSFFDGNEMEGHTLIATIKAPSLDVEPSYDFDKGLWLWEKLSEETKQHRKWWKDRL